MVDDSNMGRIEAMFYEQITAAGATISGQLRRYAQPLPLPSGAVKEWLVTLTYEDGTFNPR